MMTVKSLRESLLNELEVREEEEVEISAHTF